jgi:hypothetical protein
MSELDDLTKAQEIAKERLSIEIGTLRDELRHLQLVRFQTQSTQHGHTGGDVVTVEEEDLALKIQLLSHEYELLVIENECRGLDQLKLGESTQNRQTSTPFLTRISTAITNRAPRIPQFESETQRYILGGLTLGLYVGLFLLYQQRQQSRDGLGGVVDGVGGSGDDTGNNNDSGGDGVGGDGNNNNANNGGFTSGALASLFTLGNGVSSALSASAKWAYSFVARQVIDDLDYQSSSSSNQLLFDTPGSTARRDLNADVMAAGGEDLIDTVADTTYDKVFETLSKEENENGPNNDQNKNRSPININTKNDND